MLIVLMTVIIQEQAGLLMKLAVFYEWNLKNLIALIVMRKIK
jgi:hypothetical protein